MNWIWSIVQSARISTDAGISPKDQSLRALWVQEMLLYAATNFSGAEITSLPVEGISEQHMLLIYLEASYEWYETVITSVWDSAASVGLY